MRVLHFISGFPRPTETFIKRYVQKSCLFGTVGIVSFEIGKLDAEMEDSLTVFPLNRESYSRKNIKGALRYIYEKASGSQSWFRRFNHVLEEFKPDIIHCHFGPEGIAMMNFERKFKKKMPYV